MGRKRYHVIREIMGRFSAVIFGLLLAWLLLEILLRLAYPLLPYILQAPLREIHITPFSDRKLLPPPVIRNDDAYQIVTRNHINNELQYFVPNVPLHVTTNNWLGEDSNVGFRVPTADWEPDWPVDAVFVGDSHTFCFTEYEECWVQILAEKYGMSVVNMGQGATGNISHLHLLQKFGLLNEPRFVIWQWYGNDANEDYGMATTYMGLEPVEPPTPKISSIPDTPLEMWLSANSAVFVTLHLLSSNEAYRYQYARFVDPYRAVEGDVDINFGREATIAGYDLSQPRNQVGFELGLEAIRDGREFLDSAGVPLLLLLLPSKEEVYGRLTTPQLGQETMQIIRESRERMLAFCAAENYLCLDATEGLTAAADAGRQLYYSYDNHLNAAGNAVLADIVWEFLVGEGLMAGP